MIPVESERTFLRSWSTQDLPALESIFCDAELMVFIGDNGKPFARDFIPTILKFCLDHYEQHGFGPAALMCKETNSLLGLAGLKNIKDSPYIDLGFAIFKPYWGRGYATEISRALIQFGFSQLKRTEVAANTHPRNVASIRVLTKVGMRYEKKAVIRGMESDLYLIRS